jgi:predicted RNase H-like nuclease (RuvC/YqgF family)
MQTERVVAILSAHDGLRAEERTAFSAYLVDVFEAASKVGTLERDNAELKSEVEALHSRVSDLKSQVAALWEERVPSDPGTPAPEAPVPPAPEAPAAQ